MLELLKVMHHSTCLDHSVIDVLVAAEEEKKRKYLTVIVEEACHASFVHLW